MTKLRPETGTAPGPALADDTVLALILSALSRRTGLIYGRLKDETGRTCAMGAFWDDHPAAGVSGWLVDLVAAANDSVPATAPPEERLRQVRNWLHREIRNRGLRRSLYNVLAIEGLVSVALFVGRLLT